MFSLILKKLPQLIHVIENAYFWFHLLQEPETCTSEDILKALYHRDKDHKTDSIIKNLHFRLD